MCGLLDVGGQRGVRGEEWGKSDFILFEVMLTGIVYFDENDDVRNDHTTMTAPLPVCSAKLSIVGPG